MQQRPWSQHFSAVAGYLWHTPTSSDSLRIRDDDDQSDDTEGPYPTEHLSRGWLYTDVREVPTDDAGQSNRLPASGEA